MTSQFCGARREFDTEALLETVDLSLDLDEATSVPPTGESSEMPGTGIMEGHGGSTGAFSGQSQVSAEGRHESKVLELLQDIFSGVQELMQDPLMPHHRLQAAQLRQQELMQDPLMPHRRFTAADVEQRQQRHASHQAHTTEAEKRWHQDLNILSYGVLH